MDVECFSVVVDYEAKAYLLFGCVMLYLLLVVWVVHASAKVAYLCHNKPLKKKDEEKNKDKNNEDDDVFANLKNYKTSTKEEFKTKLTKNDVVCDEANKYIRKGKFSDHSEWMASKQEVKEESTTSSSSGGMMSWLEWKNSSKKD